MNLLTYQDKEYKTFTSKLVTTKYEIIGVRLPILRKLAKSLKIEDLNNLYYFEDYMLYGFVIGREKDFNKVKQSLDKLVPRLDNWSLCDSLVSSLKITKKYKKEMLEYILKYQNKSVFETRFLIVMLIRYYVKEDIEMTLKIIKEIQTGEYYIDMAIAWLLAEACIYNNQIVINYLKNERNNFIVNKTISKVRESYRINYELKKELLNYKK